MSVPLEVARVNRAAAKAAGLTHYEGTLCRRGHDGMRFTCTGSCVSCLVLTASTRYASKRDQILAQTKAYRAKNAEAVRERDAAKHERNRDQRLQMQRAYYHSERGAMLREARKNDPQARLERREYYRETSRRRRATDPQTAISTRVRNRLRIALTKSGGVKSGKTVDLLGCNWAQFVEHLESLFQPGMSWHNIKDWHLDHVIPLAAYDLTDEAQLRKACHFTNIQPLWAADNIRKGARVAA